MMLEYFTMLEFFRIRRRQPALAKSAVRQRLCWIYEYGHQQKYDNIRVHHLSSCAAQLLLSAGSRKVVNCGELEGRTFSL